jgi:hypothetical protein
VKPSRLGGFEVLAHPSSLVHELEMAPADPPATGDKLAAWRRAILETGHAALEASRKETEEGQLIAAGSIRLLENRVPRVTLWGIREERDDQGTVPTASGSESETLISQRRQTAGVSDGCEPSRNSPKGPVHLREILS